MTQKKNKTGSPTPPKGKVVGAARKRATTTSTRRKRSAKEGDVAPELSPEGIETFEVEQATAGAQDSKLVALVDILCRES